MNKYFWQLKSYYSILWKKPKTTQVMLIQHVPRGVIYLITAKYQDFMFFFL